MLKYLLVLIFIMCSVGCDSTPMDTSDSPIVIETHDNWKCKIDNTGVTYWYYLDPITHSISLKSYNELPDSIKADVGPKVVVGGGGGQRKHAKRN